MVSAESEVWSSVLNRVSQTDQKDGLCFMYLPQFKKIQKEDTDLWKLQHINQIGKFSLKIYTPINEACLSVFIFFFFNQKYLF